MNDDMNIYIYIYIYNCLWDTGFWTNTQIMHIPHRILLPREETDGGASLSPCTERVTQLQLHQCPLSNR